MRKKTDLTGIVRIFRSFLSSSRLSRELREHFNEIETYCMFIGQPRSGHTMVGTLIDAHPDAVVSNELHALRYLRYHFSRDWIYYLIVDRAKRFAAKGRKDPKYTYFVPNQWHGKFRRLRVIGDKKGAGSVDMLHRYPYLLKRLQEAVRIPIGYIHVVRNPYDNISTIARHEKNGDIGKATKGYFRRCSKVNRLKERIDPSRILEVRHESLIGNSRYEIMRICHFLGLEPLDDYVADCMSIIYEKPNRSRLSIQWTGRQIDDVREGMEKFQFLKGYTFTDGE